MKIQLIDEIVYHEFLNSLDELVISYGSRLNSMQAMAILYEAGLSIAFSCAPNAENATHHACMVFHDLLDLKIKSAKVKD